MNSLVNFEILFVKEEKRLYYSIFRSERKILWYKNISLVQRNDRSRIEKTVMREKMLGEGESWKARKGRIERRGTRFQQSDSSHPIFSRARSNRKHVRYLTETRWRRAYIIGSAYTDDDIDSLRSMKLAGGDDWGRRWQGCDACVRASNVCHARVLALSLSLSLSFSFAISACISYASVRLFVRETRGGERRKVGKGGEEGRKGEMRGNSG